MELCNEQKLIIVFLILLAPIFLAYFSGWTYFLQELSIEITGGLLVAFIFYWLIRRTGEIQNIVKGFEILRTQEERRRKQEIRLEKLKDNVFTPWSRIERKRTTEFKTKIPFYVEKDSVILEEAKNYLNDEYDEGKKIFELINEIENLEAESNNIGDDIIKNIEKHFFQSYEFIKKMNHQNVSMSDDCYVIDNITFFVEAHKEALIKDTGINWNKISLEIIPHENIWRLIGYAVCLIQSKNQEDVSKLRFKCVIEKLIQEISDNLKQLNMRHEEIDNCLYKFREMVNRLSRKIELHRV